MKNPEQLELLRQIDVLVDGPFVQALRDEDLFFRGSSNQRIINVQKSLKEGRVIELNLTTETRIRYCKSTYQIRVSRLFFMHGLHGFLILNISYPS